MLSPRRSVGSSIFGGVVTGYTSTSPSTSHPPSPSNGAATPPSSPIPPSGSRPHDVLANRLHEVKRITKSLVAYFEGQSPCLQTAVVRREGKGERKGKGKGKGRARARATVARRCQAGLLIFH